MTYHRSRRGAITARACASPKAAAGTDNTLAKLRVATGFARESLTAYGHLVSRGLFKVPRHVRFIASVLEAVEAGKLGRVIITIPPRHSKSMTTSEFFPAWFLGRNPTRYVISATYAQDLADDFGRKVRNQLSDPLHRVIFGGCELSRDSRSVSRFTTVQGGAYFGVGVGGPITGRGAHLALIDDPLKGRKQAESAMLRRQLKEWYTSVLYTRLQPGGAIVVIQTRWHEDDLAGWLLREHAAEGWTLVNLPAVAEEGDLLGRKVGDALWPDAYDETALEAIRAVLGSRDWLSLYQQRPTPAEGGTFKLSWFDRYTTRRARPERRIQSWDTASKPGELNDWHACITLDEHAAGWDIGDVFRRQLEYHELRHWAINLGAREDPSAVLIEDKGHGTALIQDLRANTRLPVIAIQVPSTESKVFRAGEVSPIVEAGKVWLPAQAAWLADFEAEVMSFPNAPHDDQVDALSQALRWARGNVGGFDAAVGVARESYTLTKGY